MEETSELVAAQALKPLTQKIVGFNSGILNYTGTCERKGRSTVQIGTPYGLLHGNDRAGVTLKMMRGGCRGYNVMVNGKRMSDRRKLRREDAPKIFEVG